MFEFADLKILAKKVFFCTDDDCLRSRMLIGSWVYLLVVMLQSLLFAAPYGKFLKSDRTPTILNRITTLTIPSRLAWCIQEVPAFFVSSLAAFQLFSSGQHETGLVLIPFAVHYFNRSFVFAFSIKTGRPVPVLTVVMAFLFCLWNGFLQSLFLTTIERYFQLRILDLLGLFVFSCGMFINIHSDGILSNLRKPGDTGYKIPYGGMFAYVSSPNYLGEILEWWGWFLISGNAASLWFAVFTSMFLGTRAYHTHLFYQEKFRGEYPSDRCALIPKLF